MIIRRIEVLEPQLANKIAAGEVVERPASVVKELVENSLDAGATSVTVEIREGGAEYIRVTDNGSGIPAADVEKAFLRHATSKLRSIEGLDGIETLGFRGEALASIASVAHVSMRTRTEEDDYGTLISLDGGSVSENSPCGCPIGTNIEVRELFYNVPARLKFLRSSRAEAAAVGDYVSRLILGDTAVSFKFISNGKPVYHSPGDGSLENAILCVYGPEIAESIYPISYDDGYIMIEGFCGDESISKGNRIHQSVFVNGRYIRSQQISFAAQRAYNTRLMVGRFPFLVLNIRISPREVDVNVHPNKLTVRFRDEERVASAVMLAVREALNGGGRQPETLSVPEQRDEVRPNTDIYSAFRRERDRGEMHDAEPVIEKKETEAHQQITEIDPMDASSEFKSAVPFLETEHAEPKHGFEPETKTPATDISVKPAEQANTSGGEVYVRDSAISEPAAEYRDMNGVLHYDFTPKPAEAAVPVPISFGISPYTVIGAVFDTYIIVEQGDTVFYIDQHAAHERILYEKLIKDELKFDSQLLLVSEVITLTPSEFGVLTENMERFNELGFDIEEFGALSVSVHSIPTGVKKESVSRLVHDMIDILMKQGSVSELDLVRSSLIQASCKHAIKAGKSLNRDEIYEILSHYADGSTPLTCPHGRPVMLKYTKRDFEKLFKRIT